MLNKLPSQFIDGTYELNEQKEPADFHSAPTPNVQNLELVLTKIITRIIKFLEKENIIVKDENSHLQYQMPEQDSFSSPLPHPDFTQPGDPQTPINLIFLIFLAKIFLTCSFSQSQSPLGSGFVLPKHHLDPGLNLKPPTIDNQISKKQAKFH
jgi:hypothetical protein